MGNKRKIDLARLRRVLEKPPRPRMQPDRRPRACCGSRQGFPHFDRCPRLAPAPQLVVDEDMSRGCQAWLDSDTIRIRVDELPDGEATVRTDA